MLDAQTFSVLATVPGSMLGFALSPDGSRVAVGGPTAGLLVSPTDAPAFAKTSGVEVACLAWNNQGLHACDNAFKDRFALGRSSDEGKAFQPVLVSFTSLRGPIASCGIAPDPASICAGE